MIRASPPLRAPCVPYSRTKYRKNEEIDMIRKIRARGNMVELISDEKGSELIGRREALLRAKAIIGLDRDSVWLVEALISAANAAKIEEDGQPYDSRNMELMQSVAQQEADKV